MADTFTTNLVLTKPEVGASADTWGTKLNSNSDAIANLFQSGPALKVANGGTGATAAAQARTNLGLGSMATQDATAVDIQGGTATFSATVIESAVALLTIKETGTATDSGGWQFRADGQQLNLYTLNDSNSASGTVYTVYRSGGAPTSVAFAPPVSVAGYPVLTTNTISSVSISEAQITDSTVFPRNASSETITGQWNFTTVPAKTSGGKFLHYASTSYVGGAVTVSTGDPTGTPATGDRWVKYVA